MQQWLETLEKALRGWAAYLKARLLHVVYLPCFERDWRALMDVLRGLVAMQGLPDEPGSRKVRGTQARRFVYIATCTRACECTMAAECTIAAQCYVRSAQHIDAP